MNQLILFSPVGGTDPISAYNCRDGSLLHICRKRMPDKVIMYMSKEILENHKTDNRYIYCLDKLAQLQNRTMQYELIKRPELENVQEFDFFYKEFRTIIQEIFQTMDDSDTLMLNVSSGTPAMKSALMVLQTLGEFPAKAIQVATPEKKMNEHHHKNYEVHVLWELNEDNEPDCEDRCCDVSCPALLVIKKEEIIKEHILAYDYRAAIDVAKTLPSQYTTSYLNHLEMAAARLMLDFSKVDSKYLPIRSSNSIKYFEYALCLKIKLAKKEYADFIRAITPLIADLFELILKQECHIDINEYSSTSRGVRKWSPSKLAQTSVEEILEHHYTDFHYGPIYSDHLKVLIENTSNKSNLIELIQRLRQVEEKLRNMTAHEIVCVTEDTILQLTGFSVTQIMKDLIGAFNYTHIKVSSDSWNSYDDMNQELIRLLENN
jgi:CRISPR type III-A/MTUBE-associated protein Csm6